MLSNKVVRLPYFCSTGPAGFVYSAILIFILHLQSSALRHGPAAPLAKRPRESTNRSPHLCPCCVVAKPDARPMIERKTISELWRPDIPTEWIGLFTCWANDFMPSIGACARQHCILLISPSINSPLGCYNPTWT